MTASAWFGCAHLLSRGSDGGAAEDGEVARDWDAVKGRLDLAVAGHRAFAPPFTSLHLQDEVIDDFVMRRLDGDEAELMHWPEFADLENWPADAQLAVHSMAWVMGTRRFDQFTIFRGAAAARDWRMAAEQCRMKPDSGTLRLRNILDRQSPLNAARVDDEGLDPALLVFDLTGLFGVQAALRSIGYDPDHWPARQVPRRVVRLQTSNWRSVWLRPWNPTPTRLRGWRSPSMVRPLWV